MSLESIRRRRLMAAALPAGGLGSSAVNAMAPPPLGHPQDWIRDAFEYAFPLYEMARTRWNAVEHPASPARGRINRVGHRPNLADHRSRAVTTPNNDTLYSSAWLDLSAGPVRIRMAAQPAGRYWSVALMDGFTNNFVILGNRLDGAGPVDVHLLSREWAGPRPAGRTIEAPGRDVWLLGRWFVAGPHDLPEAQAMQQRLAVEPTADAPQQPRPRPQAPQDPAEFLDVVNDMLARNPPPAAERERVARWSAAGLRAGGPGAFAELPSYVQNTWRERMPALHAALREGLEAGARDFAGWRLPAPGVGDFGNDHALRARVALGGLAALPPAEAVYYSRSRDEAGAGLSGTQRYRVRIPASGVPNDAFWSLSVYEALPDGRRFFTENAIGRYAVNSRTPGLQPNADGSLDLWLQREAPADAAQRANWLPAPPQDIHLTLRAYLPKPELREGRAPLPTVQRLG